MIPLPVIGLLVAVFAAMLAGVLLARNRDPFLIMIGVIAGLFLTALVVGAGLQLLDLAALEQENRDTEM